MDMALGDDNAQHVQFHNKRFNVFACSVSCPCLHYHCVNIICTPWNVGATLLDTTQVTPLIHQLFNN